MNKKKRRRRGLFRKRHYRCFSRGISLVVGPLSCLVVQFDGVIENVVTKEALRRTSAMSAERRQQRFYEGGQDYLERRRESARLSRAGGVAAVADSEDGPVGEDQVHMVPSLLRIGTSDGAYDAIDDLVEEDDDSEDDSGMEEMVEDSSDDCMSDNARA